MLSMNHWFQKLLTVAVVSAAVTTSAAPPVIIAHRGASGYLPEHTLPAKAMAYAMGVDYLEQDVVLSKDAVPIVLHDINIDTVTDVARRFPDRKRSDGRYYALDFTLAELKQLKVTERFNAKTGKPYYPGRFPQWQASFELTTLEEELQFIQGLNHSTGKNVGVYPEIKQPAWHRKEGQDISPIVLAMLAKYGYKTKTDNFFLQCFEYDEVKRIRTELGFQGRMILLMGADAKTTASRLTTREGLVELAQIVDGIGPAFQQIVMAEAGDKAKLTVLVKDAHAAKLLVHPYTVRADSLPKYVKSADELYRLLLVDAGVDGLFTDQPDLGVAFVRAMGK